VLQHSDEHEHLGEKHIDTIDVVNLVGQSRESVFHQNQKITMLISMTEIIVITGHH